MCVCVCVCIVDSCNKKLVPVSIFVSIRNSAN